jgi:RNA polymerase primary sigma factor
MGITNYSVENGIEIYLREIGKVPLLTPKQEVQLAGLIKKGDAEARELMIKSNLRLVVKIAHDYAGLGLPLLDLVSEGNIGLMKAVERFDPKKGAKFSTYAAWWIKQSIRRALSNQSKTIRLPVHLTDAISRMRRITFALSEELGRDPTDEELGSRLGITAARVNQLRTMSITPASLNASVGDDDDASELGELIKDQTAPTPFEVLRDKNLGTEIQSLMGELNERESVIITKRFGLDGSKPKTLEEVGKAFRVSRERIRQIQDVALAKLRRAMAKRESHPAFSNN